MFYEYSFNRSMYAEIYRFCAAITNYHIRIHLLTEADPLDPLPLQAQETNRKKTITRPTRENQVILHNQDDQTADIVDIPLPRATKEHLRPHGNDGNEDPNVHQEDRNANQEDAGVARGSTVTRGTGVTRRNGVTREAE